MTTRRKTLTVAVVAAVISLAVVSADHLAMAQAGQLPAEPLDRPEVRRREGRNVEPGVEAARRRASGPRAGLREAEGGPNAAGQGARAERIKQLEKQVLKAVRQRRPEMLPKLKELRQRDKGAYYQALRGIVARARQGRAGGQAYGQMGAGARGMGQRGQGLQQGARRQWQQGGAFGVPQRGLPGGQLGRGPAGYYGQGFSAPQVQALRRQRAMRQRQWGVGGPGAGFQPRQGWAAGAANVAPRGGQGAYQQMPAPGFGFHGRGLGAGQEFPRAPRSGYGGGGAWFAPRPGF